MPSWLAIVVAVIVVVTAPPCGGGGRKAQRQAMPCRSWARAGSTRRQAFHEAARMRQEQAQKRRERSEGGEHAQKGNGWRGRYAEEKKGTLSKGGERGEGG